MKKAGAIDGNALRTQRTVERILAESLRLFNEQGEGNVATGTIATSLGMSPGNLYYHFRNKERIVEALFRRFEARIDAMRATPDEIRTVARNALVVATYWLNYRSVRRRDAQEPGDDLGQGAYQVLALFAPYLRGEAREHLEALGKRYID
jgi:AcrR family transcriptional regulator